MACTDVARLRAQVSQLDRQLQALESAEDGRRDRDRAEPPLSPPPADTDRPGRGSGARSNALLRRGAGAAVGGPLPGAAGAQPRDDGHPGRLQPDALRRAARYRRQQLWTIWATCPPR